MCAEFFPRRKPREEPEPQQFIDSFCHWDASLKRHMMCEQFYFARAEMRIVPDHALGCWVMPDAPRRRMSWAAKYQMGESGEFVDHDDEPYQIHDCCFCGGETIAIPLPRLA